eukprot:TRINITY_DN2806_c0_g1_i15.p1 TRINITY_DN2806_c0_g1~~TRINITY_DN2806_c0_g1_i15.p1  ORF type:complete len:1439 (+),score=275.64 TRINITY_DN2806_c0_g1_i15:244-4317(+)
MKDKEERFFIHPGLTGEPQTVSFQCVNRPGFFLVFSPGDKLMSIDHLVGKTTDEARYQLFQLNSTFFLNPNFFGEGRWAIQSANHTSFFVKRNGEGRLSLSAFQKNDSFISEASWSITGLTEEKLSKLWAPGDPRPNYVGAISNGAVVTSATIHSDSWNLDRLFLDSPVPGMSGCYLSGTLDQNQYIQVAETSERSWVGIAIQGRPDADQRVTKYVVSASSDGNRWTLVEGGRVYPGPLDSHTIARNWFDSPVKAKFLRLQPKEWAGHIAIRCEFYHEDDSRREKFQFRCHERSGWLGFKNNENNLCFTSEPQQFYILPGFTGLPGTVSFHSVTRPGHFIRTFENGTTGLSRISPGAGNVDLIRLQSTFFLRYERYFPKTFSIESDNHPTCFLVVPDNGGVVTQSEGGFNNLENFKKWTSFDVENLSYEKLSTLWNAGSFVPPYIPAIRNGASVVTATSYDNPWGIDKCVLRHDFANENCFLARTLDKNQWLQVVEPIPRTWVAVDIQGRPDADQWVTQFTVSYDTGKEWKFADDKRIFSGPKDKSTIIRHYFKERFTSSMVRIEPQGWNGHIAMRCEFYHEGSNLDLREKFSFVSSKQGKAIGHLDWENARLSPTLQSFFILPGLSGNPGSVSLHSPYKPSYFLRHRKDGNLCWSNLYSSGVSPDLYRLQTTFFIRQNKFFPDTFALESDNHPGHFVTAKANDELVLTNEFNNDSMKGDASFKVSNLTADKLSQLVARGKPRPAPVEAIKNGAVVLSSSVHSPAWDVDNILLDNTGNCFLSGTLNNQQYIQLVETHSRVWVGVALQGRRDADQYINTFQVAYGDDGVNWTLVDDGRTFSGPLDNITVAYHHFEKPFAATHVRLLVRTWTSHIAVKCEFYYEGDASDLREKFKFFLSSNPSQSISSRGDGAVVDGPEQKFFLLPGLTGKRGTVSLYSALRPGCFLSHQNPGDNMQVVSLKPDYRLGCLKATFILRYNKFVPNTWALESDNHRGFFVRANGANLSLQREEDNVTFRSQASFFVENLIPEKLHQLVGGPLDADAACAIVGGATVTTSTVHSESWNCERIRLEFNSSLKSGGDCFLTGTVDSNQWVQIVEKTARTWVGVSIQGRPRTDQRVTKFTLSTSNDGSSWSPVDGGRVFDGSLDSETVFCSVFKNRVQSTHVRLHPREWSGHIAIRCEFYYAKENGESGMPSDYRTNWVFTLPVLSQEPAPRKNLNDGTGVGPSILVKDWKYELLGKDQEVFNLKSRNPVDWRGCGISAYQENWNMELTGTSEVPLPPPGREIKVLKAEKEIGLPRKTPGGTEHMTDHDEIFLEYLSDNTIRKSVVTVTTVVLPKYSLSRTQPTITITRGSLNQQ